MVRPQHCYTIWFSQRTGSTLLATALALTGVAGKPGEWLYAPEGLLAHYETESAAEMLTQVWAQGSTENGVFGLKHSFYEPAFTAHVATLRQLPGCPPGASRADVWANAFPNGRHIFMTRRNKVRLAVSWWKAIQTQQWHRERGAALLPAEPAAYNFAAIDHLYDEASMREAGIQAFFAEAGIVPLTIVYEDFAAAYEQTVRRVLDFLELEATGMSIPPPAYEPLADEVSERWVQRFREEKQEGWRHRGW